MRKLEAWEREFNSVGWFIPAYVQMGTLASLAASIKAANGTFSQDDLEVALASFYEPQGLAAMVVSRYPIAPAIQEYQMSIAEAVQAHFFGLHHVAVAGLLPVIEGAGRELSKVRRAEPVFIKDVFTAIAADCRDEAHRKGLGDSDEVESMLVAFENFTRGYVYEKSTRYALIDGTNRHGILHGAYRDNDFGRPLNFYKAISALDFLTFVSSFRANISWFAPPVTPQSMELADYYLGLQQLAASRRL